MQFEKITDAEFVQWSGCHYRQSIEHFDGQKQNCFWIVNNSEIGISIGIDNEQAYRFGKWPDDIDSMFKVAKEIPISKPIVVTPKPSTPKQLSLTDNPFF